MTEPSSPVADALTPPAAGAGSACLNCGAVLTGRWCAACGQKRDIRRLSLQHLVREVPHAVFHVDHGLVPTLKGLLLRPGQVVSEYLEGKRARYFNPLTLLVIASALCGGAWALFPFRPELFWPLVPRTGGERSWTLVGTWFKLVGATQLAWLPLMALVLFGAWRRSLLNSLMYEGRIPARWSIVLRPARADLSVLKSDPRYRLYGESIAAAAFVTAISLLITAAFAPLFALAQTPEHYRALIVVGGLAASLPALQLLRTSPRGLGSNWYDAAVNGLTFAVGTPIGFLLTLVLLAEVRSITDRFFSL